MKISIIIPTYKRPSKLEFLLENLSNQSHLPDEILVVDNASDHLTRNVVLNFQKQDIICKYLSTNINSISVARNMGALNAKGDYLIFLDDDDCPSYTYLEEIIKCFYRNPSALLVQGNIVKSRKSNNFKNRLWDYLWNYYNRLFLLFRNAQCEKSILASGKTTFPIDCEHDFICQWASGGATCIKKEVINNFLYDEKLVTYCYGEDADFSFRIYKSNPKSILLCSKAILLSSPSLNKENPAKKSIIMEKTYSLYFVSKNLNKKYNLYLFIWSEIGMFIKDCILLIFFFQRNRAYFIHRVIFSLYAYAICIKYFDNIRNLDVSSINERYLI